MHEERAMPIVNCRGTARRCFALQRNRATPCRPAERQPVVVCTRSCIARCFCTPTTRRTDGQTDGRTLGHAILDLL